MQPETRSRVARRLLADQRGDVTVHTLDPGLLPADKPARERWGHVRMPVISKLPSEGRLL